MNKNLFFCLSLLFISCNLLADYQEIYCELSGVNQIRENPRGVSYERNISLIIELSISKDASDSEKLEVIKLVEDGNFGLGYSRTKYVKRLKDNRIYLSLQNLFDPKFRQDDEWLEIINLSAGIEISRITGKALLDGYLTVRVELKDEGYWESSEYLAKGNCTTSKEKKF